MANATRAPRPERAPGEIAVSVLKWIGIVAAALVTLGVATFGIVYATTSIPQPNEEFQTNTTRVYYRDGTQENGVPIADAVRRIREAIASHALVNTAEDLA